MYSLSLSFCTNQHSFFIMKHIVTILRVSCFCQIMVLLYSIFIVRKRILKVYSCKVNILFWSTKCCGKWIYFSTVMFLFFPNTIMRHKWWMIMTRITHLLLILFSTQKTSQSAGVHARFFMFWELLGRKYSCFKTNFLPPYHFVWIFYHIMIIYIVFWKTQ